MALSSFTIYTLGDTSSFWTMLNAVAMFFSDRGLFESAALLGSLIAIIYLIMNLIPGSSVTSNPVAGFVGLGIVYTLSAIPTSVVVQNIYTGSIVKVDNIPAIISIPASAFTKAAYNVFQTSETVFQSVDGRYQTVKDNGFTSPLKLLFALRKGLPQEAPLLALNIKTFAKDCITNSDAFKDEMTKAPNALTYMLDHGNPTSLTFDYPANSSDPVGTNCGAEAGVLKTRAEEFFNGNLTYGDVNAIINQNMTKMSATKPGAGSLPYTLGDSQAQVNNIIGQNLNGAVQDQRDIMSNLITYDVLKNGMACSGVGANAQQANACWLEEAAARQAEEQWKADAAAAGSMFTKLMRPAIQFFQLMFFAFSPFAIIAALLMAGRSLGMIVKYLMFGAWTISWLPFTSVIQMYIQNEVSANIASMAKPAANGVGGITMANTPAMYEMLSVNLALASDLLAAVPLFSFAILTGGAMAMTSLAERLSTRDKFDEKSVSPSQISADPSVKIQSMSSFDQYSGGNTGYSAPTVSLTATNSSAASSALSKLNSASDTLNSGFSALNDKAQSHGSSAFKDEAARLDYTKSFEKSKQSTDRLAKSIQDNFSIGEDKAIQLANQLTVGVGTGSMLKALSVDAQAKGSSIDSETYKKAKAFDESHSKDITEAQSARQALSAAASKSVGYKESKDIKDSNGESISMSEAVSRASSTSQSFSSQAASGFATGLSVSGRADSLGQQLLRDPSANVQMQNLMNDAKGMGFDESFANQMKANISNMVANGVSRESAAAGSVLMALQSAASDSTNPNQQLAQQQMNQFANNLGLGSGVQGNASTYKDIKSYNGDGLLTKQNIAETREQAVKVGASDGGINAVGSNKDTYKAKDLNLTKQEISQANANAAKEKGDSGITGPSSGLGQLGPEKYIKGTVEHTDSTQRLSERIMDLKAVKEAKEMIGTGVEEAGNFKQSVESGFGNNSAIDQALQLPFVAQAAAAVDYGIVQPVSKMNDALDSQERIKAQIARDGKYIPPAELAKREAAAALSAPPPSADMSVGGSSTAINATSSSTGIKENSSSLLKMNVGAGFGANSLGDNFNKAEVGSSTAIKAPTPSADMMANNGSPTSGIGVGKSNSQKTQPTAGGSGGVSENGIPL